LIDHRVCDAWPVRRQTYGYLPGCRASPPFGRYQIILLGDRIDFSYRCANTNLICSRFITGRGFCRGGEVCLFCLLPLALTSREYCMKWRGVARRRMLPVSGGGAPANSAYVVGGGVQIKNQFQRNRRRRVTSAM